MKFDEAELKRISENIFDSIMFFEDDEFEEVVSVISEADEKLGRLLKVE